MRRRLRSFWLVFAMSVGLIVSASSSQAIHAALTLEGGVQGSIEGENTIPGREQTIEVLGYADGLVTPSTPPGQTGLGPPDCRPLTIRKLIGRATPKLAEAWGASEVMSVFELRFYEPGGTHYFTIELDNPVILSISRAGGEDDDKPQEQVTFGFSHVTYTHVISGNSSQFACVVGGGGS